MFWMRGNAPAHKWLVSQCALFAGTCRLLPPVICISLSSLACFCKVCIVLCSRTGRRLFWYVLSAMLCVWSVMMLKNVEIDSSKFAILMVFSVSTSDNGNTKTQWSNVVVTHLRSSYTSS